MLTIFMLIYAFFIVLMAGRLLFELPAIRIDGERPEVKVPVYFMAGSVVISLYMFLLFLIKVKYSILSISAPFLAYFIYYIYNNRRYIKFGSNNITSYSFEIFQGLMKRENIIFNATLLMLSLMVIDVFMQNLIVPIYIGDVYCMWFFKPKAIFYAKTIPIDLFTNINLWYTTFIYPLLTSLNVAWIAICLGTWTDTITKTFYSLQYLSTIIFFYAMLKRFVDRNIAIIGTFATFTIPHIVGDITTGYVDLIVSFFGFFSMMFLYQWINEPKNKKFLYISAFFIGAAAWTHNEGLMLFAAVMLTLLTYCVFQLIKKKVSLPEILIDLIIFFMIYAAVTGPFKVLCRYFGLKEFWVSSLWQLFAITQNLWRAPLICGYMLYEVFLDTYLWLYFWIFALIFIVINRKNILSSNLQYLLLFVIFAFLMVFEVFFVANVNATAGWLEGSIKLNLDRAMLIIPPVAGFLMFASSGRSKNF